MCEVFFSFLLPTSLFPNLQCYMNMMENVNPASNPACGSTVPCLQEVLLMFQAAFWDVRKTKLMSRMPDSCKQLCIWCKKELLYFYWEREMFSPSENHLTALWGPD